MRLPPPRLPPIPTSTIDAATTYSSLFNGRAQYTWRRSYSDRPFITGDSHHTDHGDSRAPQTPPQPNFHPRPPPTFARSPDASGAAFVNYGFPAWAPPQQQFAPRPHLGFHPAPSHYGQPLPQFRYPPNFRSPPPHFRPPPNFRPSPPHRPPDYREWKFVLTQSLPQSERFTVVSYNILADYLAREHRPQLYFHIPHHVLEWEWRKRRLMIEFGLWNPDILCLQEVDKFHDIEEELTARGYTGIWKMRTGNAVDGCAIFWRTNRPGWCHEELGGVVISSPWPRAGQYERNDLIFKAKEQSHDDLLHKVLFFVREWAASVNGDKGEALRANLGMILESFCKFW